MRAPGETEKRCPLCDGTGYQVLEREGLGYAAPCACAEERQQAARERQAGIPERFRLATFETFQTRRADNPAAGRVLSQAFVLTRTWAKDYLGVRLAGKRQGLLFTGPTGTGKTHLAVAALKEVLGKGSEGVFYEFQTLVSSIARSWNRDAGSAERSTFNTAVETELLVIDDLGALRALEWAEDIITEIITRRYNAMKPLIVTTNLPDPELHSLTIPADGMGGMPRIARSLADVIGERSRSRLFEMCKVIDMSGIDDFRLRQTRRPAS